MEKHSVGQTIAALRKKKGWTQVELAEKLQVSDKAVCLIGSIRIRQVANKPSEHG